MLFTYYQQLQNMSNKVGNGSIFLLLDYRMCLMKNIL